MRLVRYCFIIIFIAALHSCADIIPLSGGAKDVIAPKPTTMEPVNGSTNTRPSEVKITFDEYVTLKDPSTSVTMSPEVGPLTTDLDKKTLTVSWAGNLKDETTYILTLNGTVKDLNEGNDSIIQVVFSTGQFIDSLQHKGKIKSAYSGEKIQNATICLYELDSVPFVNQPSYYTRSDKEGNYNFTYIKDNNYQLFAFQDINKNAKVDAIENIAFASETISVKDTLTSELRLFKSKKTQNKLKITIEKPGAATVSGVNFDSTALTINGTPVRTLEKLRFDSLRVALPYSDNDNYRFETIHDTIVRRHIVSDRKANFAIKLIGGKQWKTGDTLQFQSNEYIERIDTNSLSFINDYGKAIPFNVFLNNGKLALLPKTQENFTVIFGKNVAFGKLNANDTVRFKLEAFPLDRCGEITLDVSAFEGDWVVELIDNANTESGKVVARKSANGSKLSFTGLIPGQYSVRCFKDENKNGIWDSGDYDEKKQPETMLRFPVKQKVRANWEVEEKLSPN